MFKEFYSENLYRAVSTFPKFTRNYSKNYKNVQYSFKKTSKKKKTLVLDIDETLVYATTNKNELRLIDEMISIKMTKFGASVKAYLSYRPFLFEMLDAVRPHFELILYTCGTASYAAAFSESVEKNGGKKYFDHVLSL